MSKNKKIFLIISGIILIAGILLLIFLTGNNKENNPPEETSIIEEIPMIEETPAPAPKPVAKPVEPPLPEGTDRFVISLTALPEDIAQNLLTGEYITDTEAFVKLIGEKELTPGAYKISKEMTPSQLLKVFSGKPYMKWVKIPPGWRKEEIAKLLADTLGWTKQQKEDWISKDTTSDSNYLEGVYSPDTYLIPITETPKNVANRLIANFNEKFSYYLSSFTAQNIKWTSALTLASIVQREAASVEDMPLIAGILWNRLNQKMLLNVDATLQYVRGDTGNGWWAPITLEDKQTDSPYNTYKYKGLPPHPICNPSIQAIEAVLNPTETDCIYYLHDKNRITHCAVAYEEHLQNIELYLKSPVE